jgi:hypothetical protein
VASVDLWSRFLWSLEDEDLCFGGCGGRCNDEVLLHRMGVLPPKFTMECGRMSGEWCTRLRSGSVIGASSGETGVSGSPMSWPRDTGALVEPLAWLAGACLRLLRLSPRDEPRAPSELREPILSRRFMAVKSSMLKEGSLMPGNTSCEVVSAPCMLCKPPPKGVL